MKPKSGEMSPSAGLTVVLPGVGGAMASFAVARRHWDSNRG
jgi:hypothetical protein